MFRRLILKVKLTKLANKIVAHKQATQKLWIDLYSKKITTESFVKDFKDNNNKLEELNKQFNESKNWYQVIS